MTSKVATGKYTRVGDKKGPLSLAGAKKKMEEDETFMYVPMFRVAGPEADVKEHLKVLKAKDNLDDKVIKDALKSAYTKSSLTKKNVLEAYESEVMKINDAKVSKAQDRDVNLLALIPILEQYRSEKKNNPGGNKLTKTNVDLKVKIDSLTDGKVLDVTNMKRKGTEIKKITFKDGGKRTRLSQQPGDMLYNVVYDPTSKTVAAAGVKNFLHNRGFSNDDIEPIVEAIRKGETVNISKAKSPTRSPLLSPKRRAKKEKENVDDILDEL